jgi:hypothetical protein
MNGFQRWRQRQVRPGPRLEAGKIDCCMTGTLGDPADRHWINRLDALGKQNLFNIDLLHSSFT